MGFAADTVPWSVSRRPARTTCLSGHPQVLGVNGAVAPSRDNRWYCSALQHLWVGWEEREVERSD